MLTLIAAAVAFVFHAFFQQYFSLFPKRRESKKRFKHFPNRYIAICGESRTLDPPWDTNLHKRKRTAFLREVSVFRLCCSKFLFKKRSVLPCACITFVFAFVRVAAFRSQKLCAHEIRSPRVMFLSRVNFNVACVI